MFDWIFGLFGDTFAKKAISAAIRRFVPLLVTYLIAAGVNPELAQQFTQSLQSVLLVVLPLLVSWIWSLLEKKEAVKKEGPRV